jgi:hypothetical protein
MIDLLEGSLCCELCDAGSGVIPVPSSRVMIPCRRDNDGGHYGCNVKIRPGEHFCKDNLRSKVITNCLHSILHWDPPLIVNRLMLITVVVCLDQEPVGIRKLIISMNSVSVSLDDHSFVGTDSSYDVVDGGGDSLASEALCCGLIGCLLLEDLPQQPACWDSIVFNHTDKIIFKTFSISCVHINREGSKTYSS